MNNQNQKSINLQQEKISERAYELWQSAGRPSGRDAEFWLQAEVDLTKGQPNQIQATSRKTTMPPNNPRADTNASLTAGQSATRLNSPPPGRASKPASPGRRASN